MFTLFIYALGFSVAPQFFASIDRTTWTWGLLVIIEVVLIVGTAFLRDVAVQAGCRDGKRIARRRRNRIRDGRHHQRGDRQIRTCRAGDADLAGERRVGLRAVLHLQPHHHRVVRQSSRTQGCCASTPRKEARLALARLGGPIST